MREERERNSVLGELGKRLRAHDDYITHEPLPRRWVDLIRYLDEQERKRLAPRQTTRLNRNN